MAPGSARAPRSKLVANSSSGSRRSSGSSGRRSSGSGTRSVEKRVEKRRATEPAAAVRRPTWQAVGSYTAVKKLGAGSGGVVYAGRCALGQPVALKRVVDGDDYEDVEDEIVCMRRLQQGECSAHIVKLIDVLQEPLTLVLELCEEDLEAVIARGPIPAEAQLSYARQLFTGVAFMHDHKVLHRDLKPGNLLLSGGVLKIADFGLARERARTMTTDVVTLSYRAPELLLRNARYTPSVDLWSAGCVLAELATGKVLFDAKHALGMICAIVKLLGAPPATLPGLGALPGLAAALPHLPLLRQVPEKKADVCAPAGLTDVLQALLVYQPERRLSARKALLAPCFR